MIDEEEKLKPITCFDVRADGYVVLGFDYADRKKVCVYDAEMKYLYGYEFYSSGSYGVGWENNYVALYLVRSDLVVLLDDKGRYVNMMEIVDCERNQTYWDNVVFSDFRYSGNKIYGLRDNMGVLNALASSHSQLVAVEMDGSETILYNANDYHTFSIIAILIGIIA